MPDTDRDELDISAISAEFLNKRIKNCRAKQIVVVLDCCYSGEFEGAKGTDVGTQATFAQSGEGRIFLTATDNFQRAWEGHVIDKSLEHSMFTHYLVQGLQNGKADLNNDGNITVSEWYDYAYQKVQAKRPTQTPKTWTQKKRGDVVIALNPHAKPKPKPIPAEIQQALLNPMPFIRKGAVEALAGMLKSTDDKGLVMGIELALRGMVDDDSRMVSRLVRDVLGSQPAP